MPNVPAHPRPPISRRPRPPPLQGREARHTMSLFFRTQTSMLGHPGGSVATQVTHPEDDPRSLGPPRPPFPYHLHPAPTCLYKWPDVANKRHELGASIQSEPARTGYSRRIRKDPTKFICRSCRGAVGAATETVTSLPSFPHAALSKSLEQHAQFK